MVETLFLTQALDGERENSWTTILPASYDLKMRIYSLLLGLIVVLVSAAYWPVHEASFMSWDDDYNILKNPYYVLGPWWLLWLKPHYGMYIPVTSTIWKFMLEIGDGEAWPFRALNIGLHLANTALVALLIREWLRSKNNISKLESATWFGAIIFALHPLQAGAVAWISGGRDLLAAFFSLLAILVFYKRRSGFVAWGLFTIALFCKPHVAVLPLAILIANWRNYFRLAPWFISALVATAITRLSQANVIDWQTPLWRRPLVMLDSFGFYLAKILLPIGLSADYGRRPETVALLHPYPIIGISLGAAIGLLLWKNKTELAQALLVWLTLMLPVSGLFDFGFQYMSTVADHYSYLGLSVLAAMAAFAYSRIPFQIGRLATVALVVALSTSTFKRATVWSNERNLYEDMLRGNAESFVALLGLGVMDCIRGNLFERGASEIERARKIRPDDAYGIADAAICAFRRGRFEDTLAFVNELKRPALLNHLEANDLAAASFLAATGGAYFYRGELIYARELFCQSTNRNPMDRDFKNNLYLATTAIEAQGSKPPDCGQRRMLTEILNL